MMPHEEWLFKAGHDLKSAEYLLTSACNDYQSQTQKIDSILSEKALFVSFI
jgi:hypothetical protein